MKKKILSMACAMALSPLAAYAEMNAMSEPALSNVYGQALSIVHDKGHNFSFDTTTNTMSFSKGSLLDIDASGTVYGYGFTVENLGWERNRGFTFSWTPPVIN